MDQSILLVDSDVAFADELASRLRDAGCLVQLAGDAAEAMELAAAQSPDLIVLTVELPTVNGFSVCNKLKRAPTLRDIPIVILSSATAEETFQQHARLKTRAHAYLHKPMEPLEVIEQIEAVFAGARDDTSYVSSRRPQPPAGKSSTAPAAGLKGWWARLF